MCGLARPAEGEGEFPAGLVAQEGEEEATGRVDPALDQALLGFRRQVLEALGNDCGMAGGEFARLAHPGVPAIIK